MTSSCPECRGVGYLLNDRHAGTGSLTGPVTLNITACYYPTCDAVVRPIASLQVMGMFTGVVLHPDGERIMALDGFTEAVYR